MFELISGAYGQLGFGKFLFCFDSIESCRYRVGGGGGGVIGYWREFKFQVSVQIESCRYRVGGDGVIGHWREFKFSSKCFESSRVGAAVAGW